MAVIDVVEELGIQVTKDDGNEIQALCPAHKDRTGKVDHSPSWYINAESGQHICFSCGFKGSLTYLVAYIKDLKTTSGHFDFDAAKRWSETFLGDTLERALSSLDKGNRILPAKTEYLKESSMALFTMPPKDVLASRSITEEACQFYGVKWDKDKRAWVCPLRDSSSGLLGWQLKFTDAKGFKWFPAGIRSNDYLFGGDRYLGGPLVVVESPLDCLRLFSAGVHHGVAVCGSEIGIEQIKKIRKADSIILAMDNDEAGKLSSKKLLDHSIRLKFDCKFFRYTTSAKDVGEMTDDEIHRGLAEARSSILGKMAIV